MLASIVTVIAYQNCGKGLISIQASSDTFRFSEGNEPEVYSLSLKSQDSDLENLDLNTSYVVVAEVINKRSDLEYHWTLECPNEMPLDYVNSTDSYVMSCAEAGEINVALALKWDGGESLPKSLSGKFKAQEEESSNKSISVALNLNQEFYVPNQTVEVHASGTLPDNFSWNVYCPGEQTLKDLGNNQNPFRFSCQHSGDLAQVEMLSDRDTFSESISFSILDLELTILGSKSNEVESVAKYEVDISPSAVPNMSTEVSYTCPQEQEKVVDSLKFSLSCDKVGQGKVQVILKDDSSGVRLMEKALNFTVIEKKVEPPVDNRVEPSIKAIQASDVDFDQKVPFVFQIVNPSKVDSKLMFSVKCPGETNFSEKVPVVLKAFQGNHSLNVICNNAKPGRLSLKAYLNYDFKKGQSATRSKSIELKEKEINLSAVKINVSVSNSKPYFSNSVSTSVSVENFSGETKDGVLDILVQCPKSSEKYSNQYFIPISPRIAYFAFTCKNVGENSNKKATITATLKVANKVKSQAYSFNYQEKVLEVAPKFVVEKVASTSDYVEENKAIQHLYKMKENVSKLKVKLNRILTCPEGKSTSLITSSSSVNFSKTLSSSCKKAGKASVQIQAQYSLNGSAKTYNSPAVAFSVVKPPADPSKAQIVISTSGELKFGESFKISATVKGFEGEAEDGKLVLKVNCPGNAKDRNTYSKTALIPMSPKTLDISGVCRLTSDPKLSVLAELQVGQAKKTEAKGFLLSVADVTPKVSMSLKSGQSLPVRPNSSLKHIIHLTENTSKLQGLVYQYLKCPGKAYVAKYIGKTGASSKNFTIENSCSTEGTAYIKGMVQMTIDSKVQKLYSNEMSFSVKRTWPSIYNSVADFKIQEQYFFGLDTSVQFSIKNFSGLPSDGTLKWTIYCPGSAKSRKVFSDTIEIPVHPNYKTIKFNCPYANGSDREADVYLNLKVGSQKKDYLQKINFDHYKQEPTVGISMLSSSSNVDYGRNIRHRLSVGSNPDKLSVKLYKLLKCPGAKNYTTSSVTTSKSSSFSKDVDSSCTSEGTAYLAAKIIYSVYGKTKTKTSASKSFKVTKPAFVWSQLPGVNKSTVSCSSLGIRVGDSCSKLNETKNCCLRFGSGRDVDIQSISTQATSGQSCIEAKVFKCTSNK